MTNTKEKVAEATANVRPYVERALRDQELRRNVRNAYSSARAVYDQLLAKHGVSDVATRLASDDGVQDELRNVVEELRQARERVQNVRHRAPEPARAARNGLLLLAGVVLGILFNPLTGPPLRRWLGRKLFGGNGFVYRDTNGTGI